MPLSFSEFSFDCGGIIVGTIVGGGCIVGGIFGAATIIGCIFGAAIVDCAILLTTLGSATGAEMGVLTGSDKDAAF